MIKTNVELHSWHALRVWIDNKKLRREVRIWFDNYLAHPNENPYIGEMEVSFDEFIKTLDNANLNTLSTDAMTIIKTILNHFYNDHRDLACVIFAANESEVEKPDD